MNSKVSPIPYLNRQFLDSNDRTGEIDKWYDISHTMV